MKSIRWKVFIPILVLFLVITVVLALITGQMSKKSVLNNFDDFSNSSLEHIYSLVHQFHESSQKAKDLEIANTERRLEHLIDGAVSIADFYHQKELSGELSRFAAQREAKEALRNFSYGGDGYFWIDTKDVVNVLFPPNPAIEGTSRYDYQDSKGSYIGRDFVEGAMANDHFFYDYYYPKPGEIKDSAKKSCIKYFEPWGWAIGTGVYIDDIDKDIAEYEAAMLSEMNKSLYTQNFMGAYPFIQDRNSTYIAYVDQDWIGQSFELKDKVSGRDLTDYMFEIQNGQVEYMWTKPGEPENKFFKKIGFVKYFPERDWMITYAVYESELIKESKEIGFLVLIVGLILWTCGFRSCSFYYFFGYQSAVGRDRTSGRNLSGGCRFNSANSHQVFG